MSYESAATFNCLTMRKCPGASLEAIGFYVQYTLACEELNPLGIVVNQDWTMDLHRDVKQMFCKSIFVEQSDVELDNVSSLSAGFANVYVLDDVGYKGIADFVYSEFSTRVTDGCFPNKVWVQEVVVQGSRVIRQMRGEQV